MVVTGVGLGQVLCGTQWMADVLYAIEPAHRWGGAMRHAAEPEAGSLEWGYVVCINTVRGTLRRPQPCPELCLMLPDGTTHALALPWRVPRSTAYFALASLQ